jgi:hypothetical protein
VKDAIFLQLRQPTLAHVFILLDQIELNVMEECVVTLGFSKDNVKDFLTPLVQGLHSYYNKTM